MLIGLVSKNGILLVEFANQRKLSGMTKLEAIKVAAATRFRPILMTSLATIFGLLPLALGLEMAPRAGSQWVQQSSVVCYSQHSLLSLLFLQSTHTFQVK